MKILFVILAVACLGFGQGVQNIVTSGIETATGIKDFHGAAKTLPNRSGTGSPNARDSCARIGETYFQTDATAGSNFWACTTTGTPGTWTLQSGGGGGGGGIVTATTGSTDPVGTCTAAGGSSLPYYIQTTTNSIWQCDSTGHWINNISTPGIGPFAITGGSGTFSSGVAASRPSCASVSYYLATDTHALTACDGTNWSSTLNPAGTVSCIFNATANLQQCYNPDGTPANSVNITLNQSMKPINAFWDGGGSALAGTITRCSANIPFAGTIIGFSATGDQSGSATVTVKAVASSSYTGPSSAADISNGGEALVSVAKKLDTTLTGWSTTFAANTTVCFSLSSPSTFLWLAANIVIAAN